MLDLTSLSFVNIVVYFLLVTTCPLQIYYINIALKYEQASRVMPLKYAGGNILIMFGSVILFHEWEFLTAIQVFGMVGGLVVAIGGIYMVVKDWMEKQENTPDVNSKNRFIKLWSWK